MNIALLTPRLPYPPDRGDRLTVFNLLRALAPRHRVTLFTFTDGTEPPRARERVAAHCASLETIHLPRILSWLQAWFGIASPLPSQVSYYRSSAMRDRVRARVSADRFDLIVNHTIRMAPFSCGLPHPRKVLILGDALGMALGRSLPFEPWWKRPGIRWERHRVDRFEAGISRHYLETWAISPDDRDDLIRIGCVNVVLVQHGVDERLFDVVREPQAGPRVLFLGNLSVPHNVDAALFAAREVWPHIRRTFPQARLVLAGADPVPAVRQLAALEGVEVTGTVADLMPVWARADVLLAPLRFSTGIQNKVLEAMAAGVPVVTTPAVAGAIDARDGEQLRVAEGAAGLARAVCETLEDTMAARGLAGRARDHVRARFSSGGYVDRLEKVVALSSPPVEGG